MLLQINPELSLHSIDKESGSNGRNQDVLVRFQGLINKARKETLDDDERHKAFEILLNAYFDKIESLEEAKEKVRKIGLTSEDIDLLLESAKRYTKEVFKE